MNENEGLPPMPAAPPGTVTALDLGAAQGFGPTAPAPQPTAVSREELDARQITSDNNPSESFEEAKARLEKERGSRVSLNAPMRKLEVPPLPGYHLHWFLERNISAALSGYYEFVLPEEVPTADRSIGGRTYGTSSEDLGGNRISQIGGTNERGLPEQLILMKIRLEWYFDEQRKIAERNLGVIKQIFQKKAPLLEAGERREDTEMRYTREATIDMSAGRFRKA